MRLSAPIYRLKRNARQLSREAGIPLNQALDTLARAEGYARWSLLLARQPSPTPAARLGTALRPGDVMLLAARPGHGKTVLALDILAHGLGRGDEGWLFTLDWTERQVRAALSVDPDAQPGRFMCDATDQICADYVMERMAKARPGALAVIDYLQILDQRRETPPLAEQVEALAQFSHEKQLRLIFLAQINRRFDPAATPLPGPQDVRLPNPVDLSLFSKTCFLQDGEMRLSTAA